MRTSEALSHGIYPHTLYEMRKRGIIEPLARGINHLVEVPLPQRYELLIVSMLIPKAVFCLISALDLHDITTQIPHYIYIAVPKGTKAPKLDYPALRVFTYAYNDYNAGLEIKDIDGFKIKAYSAEKTVVDCFKYRNKIGLDVALESLRLCMDRKRSKPADFLKFARISRVKNIISPYLEAMYE